MSEGRCTHSWEFKGGRNAGCSDDCICSVPVYTCGHCGDCDYGENDEAIQVKWNCRLRRDGMDNLIDETFEEDEVEIEFELATNGAELECKEYEHNPEITIGLGENCPTPNKFDFCRYCCWQPDQLDQFWARRRQDRLLRKAEEMGLVMSTH